MTTEWDFISCFREKFGEKTKTKTKSHIRTHLKVNKKITHTHIHTHKHKTERKAIGIEVHKAADYNSQKTKRSVLVGICLSPTKFTY
jgi:hypothetical protein